MLALPAELEPFRATLARPDFATLAQDTWRWLSEQAPSGALSERKLPALVTVACVYARLCAPTWASPDDYRVVARFTLLFFLVDDAALSELSGVGGAPWAIGRFSPALKRWLSDFDARTHADPPLRARFERAYHDYLAARLAEHAHHLRPPSVEEHWAFRRRSIFMDPYLDLWLMLGGVDLARLNSQGFAEARRMAVDLVLLANDLGSAERDSSGGASPDDLNLLHGYARELGLSDAGALEHLIELHEARVGDYRRRLAAAVANQPGPHAHRYAELLHGVVDGNVASVLALAFRYPGAEPVMRRLSPARA
jgi:hypothetical protein